MNRANWMHHRRVWAAVFWVAGSFGWPGPLLAGPVISAGHYTGVTNDLFDVSRGSFVTAFSPQVPGSDPRSALGYTSTFVEPTNTIFSDDHAPGFTDFIEFRLPRAINLTSFKLGLNQDGASAYRSASSFNLLASADGSSFRTISSGTILPNYLTSYGDGFITVSDTLSVRGAQNFRLELTQATSGGVRVGELDGFGNVATPEPSSLALLGLGTAGLLGYRLRRRKTKDGPDKNLKRSVLVVVGVLLIVPGTSRADFTVSKWLGGGESTTDPFDVSRGTTVLASSPLLPGSDARSAIGYYNAGFIEPNNTYFADNGTPGAVDFITFKTTKPVSVSGFDLRTYDDSYSGVGNGNRGFTSVTLLGSTDGVDYSVLASGPLGNSYDATYGSPDILVHATFAPTADQYFRFEGTRYNTTGPRIVELDGISPTPEPASAGLLAAGLTCCGAYRVVRTRRKMAERNGKISQETTTRPAC